MIFEKVLDGQKNTYKVFLRKLFCFWDLESNFLYSVGEKKGLILVDFGEFLNSFGIVDYFSKIDIC